jgi:hypothetical protein
MAATSEVAQPAMNVDTVEMHLRLDVPGEGRLLGIHADKLATRFRTAVGHLATSSGPQTVRRYNDVFGLRDPRLGSPALAHDPRPEWAVVGMYAVALLHSGQGLRGFRAAEAWFTGGSDALSSTYPSRALERAELALAEIDVSALGDLLPYVIDPHGLGTRRSVIRDPSQTSAREAKRQHGIYYTPGDVADFMAARVMATNPLCTVDPACGTGVFLRAAARARTPSKGIGKISGLYGLDLDPLAIDGACFVLAATVDKHRDGSALRSWHLARLNLAHRDSLEVLLGERGFGQATRSQQIAADRLEISSQLMAGVLPDQLGTGNGDWLDPLDGLFPEATGAFAVIGNPPYAPLGARPDLLQLSSHLTVLAGSRATAATNAYVPFLEYLAAPVATSSASAFVVPMSIAYNTTSVYKAARAAISRTEARWTFWFFDRTPDSLFGDDIKQRTAIVLREPADGFSVSSTGIRRWTSRDRHRLFTTLQNPVDLGPYEINRGVPKVGTPWEADLLRCVRRSADVFSDFLSVGKLDPGAALAVGDTAYNHLVVYREGGDGSRVSATALQASDTTSADWAYAVLESTLVYWLWRVDGDGFHVPRGWVLGLPFAWHGTDADRLLARLGADAWRRSLANAVRATNSGRQTISYVPDDGVIAEIDQALLARLGLESGLAARLREFRLQAIEAGRVEHVD